MARVTTSATVFGSIGDFTALFSANTSGAGRWAYDSGGSTVSGGTGPGTNNSLGFSYTETSGISHATGSTHGIAVFDADEIPAGTDRDFALRLCLQGDFGDDDSEGLRIEARDDDSSAWSLALLVRGWGYSNLRDVSDTFNDTGGVTRTVVQDGGWVDYAIRIPDSATQVRLVPVYIGGSTFRHDIAFRQFHWSYEEVEVIKDLGTLGLTAGTPTLAAVLTKETAATKSLGTIGLTADNPTISSPTLTKETPATPVIKVIGPIALSTGRPTISGAGSGALAGSEVNGEDEVNVDFIVGPRNPVLEKTASLEPKGLGTIGLSAGTPTLSAVLAKQAAADKDLGTIGLTIGTPALSSPSLAKLVPTTKDLGTIGLTTGDPTVNSPTLTKTTAADKDLGAVGLTTGGPTLSSPTITKDTPGVVEIASVGGSAESNYSALSAIGESYVIRFTSHSAAQYYWDMSDSQGTLLDNSPSGMFTDGSIFWIERFGFTGAIRLHRGGSSVHFTNFVGGLPNEASWVIIDESTETWLMIQANVRSSSGGGFYNISSPFTEVAKDIGTAASSSAWLNDLASRELVVALIPNNTFRPFAAAGGAPIALSTGNPTLNSPTLIKQAADNKDLGAIGLTAGDPTLSVALGQDAPATQDLGTIGLTTGDPTLNSPTITKDAPATKPLGSVGLATGTPTLTATLIKDAPATRDLGVSTLTTGNPTLDRPVLTKETPATRDLGAIGLTTGTPTVNSPSLTKTAPLLILDHFNTFGIEVDAAALLVRSGTDPFYADSDRGGMDMPLEGELGLSDTEAALSRIRTYNDGERLLLNSDAGTLSLSVYFTSGGAGDDLSLYLQTSPDDVYSFPITSNIIGTPGPTWINLGLPTELQTAFAGIEVGDRFIIAIARQIQAQDLGTIGLTAGDPTLSSPSLSKDTPVTKALGAASLTTGDPVLGSPTLSKRAAADKDLGAIGLTTGDPTLSSPTITKDTPADKDLGAIGLSAGTPALNSPDLTKDTPGNKDLGAIGLATGDPTLAATLSKQELGAKGLGAVSLATGDPTLNSPTLTKQVPATKALGTIGLTTGAPTVNSPTLTKQVVGNKDLGTIGLTTGDPTLNSPTLAKDTPADKALGAIGLTAGAPTLNSPTLTKETPAVKALGDIALSTGVPTVNQPTLAKGEVAVKTITATMTVGDPTITVDLTKQTPAVKSITVEMRTGTPEINEVSLVKIENDPTSLGSVSMSTGAPSMAVTLDKIEAGSAIVATIQAGSGDTMLATGITISQVQVFNDASGVVVHRDDAVTDPQSLAQWARTVGRGLSFYFICEEGTLEFPVGLATTTDAQIEWEEAHSCMVLSSGEEMRMVVASSGGLGRREELRPLIAGAMPERPA